MPLRFWLVCPNLLLLILLLLAPTYTTPVLADCDPITGLDTHDQQMLEKRRELRRKQEELLSKTDQLYNEANTEREANFFEENGWNLLALSCVSLVILRLVIRPRHSKAELASATVITHTLLPKADSEQSIIDVEQEPGRSDASSFLAMMGMTSQRRHGRRSHSHRHRRRSH